STFPAPYDVEICCSDVDDMCSAFGMRRRARIITRVHLKVHDAAWIRVQSEAVPKDRVRPRFAFAARAMHRQPPIAFDGQKARLRPSKAKRATWRPKPRTPAYRLA